MERQNTGSCGYLCLALAIALSFVMCLEARAETISVHHDLAVRLELKSKKLLAHDNMLISRWQGKDLIFLIAPQARIKSITVNGRATKYSFQSGRFTLATGLPKGTRPISVRVSYEAVFEDNLPDAPVSFDNPGFGVEGTITERGVFLLPGSGWYPQLPDSSSDFRLEVIAPRGIYAVTTGKVVKHEDRKDESISVWEVNTSLEGPALSAGPYVIRSRMSGSVQISTYFFPQTDALSDRYLSAAASHIQFYEKLHGPYPFPKFAVVENFFPTGYGFPSYTLLGTAVLKLPFIPETSLKHEVAHSWWGNGVLVDYDAGNWCEGLTTYVADYLSQELISPKDGKTYRQQILQDYATLAGTGGDFPLRQFTSRTSPASRAVGYGKAAFVFHMVRKHLGDDLFWQSLRRLFKERLFKKTSWDDIRDIFVKEGRWEAGEAQQFFDQWLTRTGAPVLEVKEVRSAEAQNKWSVEGKLSQAVPAYRLDVPLRLQTPVDSLDKVTRLTDVPTSFDLRTSQAPQRLTVDPECDLFRLLYPAEIPATVNSLKASKDLVAILGSDLSADLPEILKPLLESLNHGDTGVLAEADVDPQRIEGRDLLFFGLPRSKALRSFIPAQAEGITLEAEKFSFDGIFSSADADTLFTVFRSPREGNGVVALLLPSSGTDNESIVMAARKITHYGKYSYLTFSRGISRAKGFWPVTVSPLVIELKQEKPSTPTR